MQSTASWISLQFKQLMVPTVLLATQVQPCSSHTCTPLRQRGGHRCNVVCSAVQIQNNPFWPEVNSSFLQSAKVSYSLLQNTQGLSLGVVVRCSNEDQEQQQQNPS
jgi:hypothetical protein